MSRFDTKFESATVEWQTPKELFNKLDAEFGFTLDVCATKQNTQCKDYFTKIDNGLIQPWSGVCWLNPPYGNRVKLWLKKAIAETERGVVTVALIPARTNTGWFHNLCLIGAEVRFLQGRPKFGNASHGLPQPLAIVIYKPINYERRKQAAAAGRLGGSSKSAAKQRAVRENGKLGGRPKKAKTA